MFDVTSEFAIQSFGQPTKLWSPHGQYLALRASAAERQERYRALFDSRIDGDLLADIR